MILEIIETQYRHCFHGLAWGIELEDEMDTVKWVMNSLFNKEILLGVDSIFEWVVLRRGTHISECFEDENYMKKYGFIPFIMWLGNNDNEAYLNECWEAWFNLKVELQKNKDNTMGNFPLKTTSKEGLYSFCVFYVKNSYESRLML